LALLDLGIYRVFNHHFNPMQTYPSRKPAGKSVT
jgi:hypothetical protein